MDVLVVMNGRYLYIMKSIQSAAMFEKDIRLSDHGLFVFIKDRVMGFTADLGKL